MSSPSGEAQLPPNSRNWLLVSLVVVILPHLGRLSIPLIALCVGTVGWRIMRELKGWRLPGHIIRFLATIVGVGAVLGSYGTIVGHQAGTALLVVMLCLKLIEAKTVRDGMVIVLLGYFVVISSFLFDQSILTGLYLLVIAVLLTAVLVVLNHPGGGYDTWRRYLRTSGVLLTQSLPLTVALFVLFPRISGSLWGLDTVGDAARTGLSDKLSMGSITALAKSDAVAFRAEFPDGLPPSYTLYWRGPVLWHTDGQVWSGLTEAETHSVKRTGDELLVAGKPMRYIMTLEPGQRRWLLGLDYSMPESEKETLTPGLQLLAPNKITKRQRFERTAYPRLQAPNDKTDPTVAYALDLPPGKNPRAVHLARQWQAEGLSPAKLVQRALNYFRDKPFFYTRRPPPLGSNAVDQFLFQTRKGFCEHFAASFATLMRAAGIPARIVTGYQGGEINRIGKFLVVRQADAHAWTEVYLPPTGWTRVDPTAVIPPERVLTTRGPSFQGTRSGSAGAQSWWAQGWRWIGQSLDAIDYGWNEWVLAYGNNQQNRLLRRMGLEKFGWKALAVLLMGTLSVGLIVATLIVLHNRKTQDPVIDAYEQFCSKLAGAGIVRMPHEGPRSFAQRAKDALPGERDSIEEITRMYEQIRYGRIDDTGLATEHLSSRVRQWSVRSHR